MSTISGPLEEGPNSVVINSDPLEMGEETASERRARILAENDSDLLLELVELRKAKKITQSVLAERMGVTQATVASFERYDSDPKLSTIRRYSHALEALVKHVVEADEGQYGIGDTWHVVSFNLSTIKSASVGTPSYATAGPKRADFAPAA